MAQPYNVTLTCTLNKPKKALESMQRIIDEAYGGTTERTAAGLCYAIGSLLVEANAENAIDGLKNNEGTFTVNVHVKLQSGAEYRERFLLKRGSLQRETANGQREWAGKWFDKKTK